MAVGLPWIECCAWRCGSCQPGTRSCMPWTDWCLHRHSCKRKLAELEGVASEDTLADSQACSSHQTKQPPPSRLTRNSQQAHAADQCHSTRRMPCPQPPASFHAGPRPQQGVSQDADHTLLNDQRSAHLPDRHASTIPAPTLSQAPGNGRHVVTSHTRQQRVHAQCSNHTAQLPQVPQQQAAHQLITPDSQLNDAEVGSTRRTEQPTASTGTSRPHLLLASGATAALHACLVPCLCTL